MRSHLCANARAWKRNGKIRAGETGGGGAPCSNEIARCKVKQQVNTGKWESVLIPTKPKGKQFGTGGYMGSQDA